MGLILAFLAVAALAGLLGFWCALALPCPHCGRLR